MIPLLAYLILRHRREQRRRAGVARHLASVNPGGGA